MRRKAQTEGYGAFLGLYPRGLAGACRIACWRVVWTQSQACPCAGDDASVAPQPLRRLQCCPAGEIARPTDQGKRQAEQGTSSLRPAFIYLVARSRQIVGRAFTPAAWGLAALPVGVLSAPKAKCPLRRGRCLCIVPQPLRRLQCCPAGEIARPTDQGKRQAEQGTSSLRPAFIYLVARSRQIVGRAFTPAAWGLAALPVGVLSAPKAKCPLRRGRCLCIVPQPLRRLQCCPAGEIARPTI